MLRHEWAEELLDPSAVALMPLRPHWLEIYPENCMRRGTKMHAQLQALAAQWRLTTHSVHMSLGGTDPLNDDHLRDLRAFCDRYEVAWCSDHLGASVHGGEILHEILPVPMNAAGARRVAARIRQARDVLQRPLAVENTAFYFVPPGSAWGEADFIAEVLHQADADLLLDVNNLYVNAVNHGYDIEAFLQRLPWQRVREIHVGGFTVDAPSGLLIDSHAAAPCAAVWRWLVEALRRTGPKPVLLEWESHFGSLSEAMLQFRHLHQAWHAAAGQTMAAA